MKKIINIPALFLIKFYKYCLSPLMPHVCRFEPSCSVYAAQSFERYHFFRASSLTAGRLLRCHPFCAGGYDPVPDVKKQSEIKL